jgi:thioredoxin reductase
MQKNSLYDVVILGAGPAGLQAAIHAARRKVSVLVFGKQAKSSLFHAHVENFCCLFNVAGENMLRTAREQAARFGAEIIDEAKYIQTDKKQRTSVPGVFAAGDICGPPWQMAKAVGEGCVAGLEAAAHAKQLKIE